MFPAWLYKSKNIWTPPGFKPAVARSIETYCYNVKKKYFFSIETLFVNRLPNSPTNLVLYLSNTFLMGVCYGNYT